ncbi:hypothetical protein [Suicoccus acidiformans]|nr:hypothetical protein [Suicoccus acidiformans]
MATPENLQLACEKVYANKGAPGMDGVTVDDIEEHISEYGSAILWKVKDGSYQPLPVKGVYIPKENGAKRVLGIPVVRDRIVQQMIFLCTAKHLNKRTS